MQENILSPLPVPGKSWLSLFLMVNLYFSTFKLEGFLSALKESS
jgi:hypothetical protein